jgi:hypothetical protein
MHIVPESEKNKVFSIIIHIESAYLKIAINKASIIQ